MSARLILAAAAAAVVAVAASGPAAALGVPKNCGTLKAGGHTWAIEQTGLTCTTARSIVKKLAALPWRPGTRPVFPGRYSGMRCTAQELRVSKLGGRHLIDCGSATTAVVAGAPG